MYRKTITTLAVATLAVVLINNWQTSKVMDRIMTETQERALHGQVLDTHGVQTQRWRDEPIPEVVARHWAVIRANRKAEEEDGR